MTRNRFPFLIAFAAAFIALSTIQANAQSEPVVVFAPKIVTLVEPDGSGLYQRILKEASRRARITFEERSFPTNRALSELKKHTGSCIYSMTPQASNLLGADSIVTSYPLGVAMLHVFSHKDTPAVTSWKELRGKTIGGTLGFEPYYTNLIDRGFSILYVGNEEKLTLMLEKERFDVMLGFLPDHFPNLDRLNYSPDFVLHQIFDFITCHKSAQGRMFVEKISPALKQMKDDGTLKVLLGDYYLDFSYSAANN